MESIIILIPKQGKPFDISFSYRPISLTIFVKMYEKQIQKRILKIINAKLIIAYTQFGFYNKYTFIYQVYHLIDAIAYSFENK